jgi:uncharacterized heparinase superfamily protein
MKMTKYIHTLRYLRPEQVYRRVWRSIYKPQADASPAPPIRKHIGVWSMCPGHGSQLLGPETFRFLNDTRRLNGADDWDSVSPDRLWLYNLHYFNDLVAEGFGERAAWHQHLLERWIKENPPTQGTGWEPYPLSLRIANWIKWALAGGKLDPVLVHSLAIQARYLFRRLEYHLLGNHLLANAKALIFAGAFFAGQEADRWLSTGQKLLRSELEEQFLTDGGHFERSPMYHSILTEDLLDLVQIRELYAPNDFRCPWRPVLEMIDLRCPLKWLTTMSHPDGEIAFFNDAAIGIASRAADLEQYAASLGVSSSQSATSPLSYLAASGYVRMQQGLAAVLFDVGRVGPDYLPAHAHADTLSFELSLEGRRVLVNSGTSTYNGPLRLWQRGTAAHNSVTVDEMDSSEVWGSFRVARRAQPLDVHVEVGQASAGHDGYRRLSGSPIHRRQCRLSSGQLQIEDTIEGTGWHRVALHFHAAPGLEINRDDDRWRLQGGTVRVSVSCPAGVQSEVVDTEYYPEFGLAVPNRTLMARWHGVLPFRGVTLISWGDEAR